jgi:hypothetical protein
MPKIITVALATLFISASPAVFAQTTGAVGPAPDQAADWKAFTDTRIDLSKVALQMTPAQEKLWPPVEDAIRARASSRYARLAKLAARQDGDHDRSPVEILRERADVLAQRSTNLKKLVDAWQPLFESLDARQKLRLRFVTVLALREMKDAVASRFWDEEADEDE